MNVEQVLSYFQMHPEITLIGAVTIIQIAPIKFDPWTMLAKAIHGILLGGIDTKLDSISEKVDKLEVQAEEDKALQARTHILRFADELYVGGRHSKEYFDDILENDIDNYERYCAAHPEFQNNKTTLSTQLIKDVYAKLMKEHKFL